MIREILDSSATTVTGTTTAHTTTLPGTVVTTPNYCPAAFLWACNTTDLFTEVVLVIVLVAFAIMFMVYLALRGPFGKMFYHADKLRICVEIDAEGSVEAYNTERFGSLERIKSGKRKGMMIIPRPNSTFKAPNTPLMSIVLGRGKGISTNPYMADYTQQMGGAWPEWNKAKPPGSPKDLSAFYLMYAEWKATTETASAKSIDEYIEQEFNKLQPPENLVNADALIAWERDKKDKIARVFQSTGGKFTEIALELKDPDTDDELKNGIYEVLNGMIQSEPVELWPTWIVGKKVTAQDLARWTMGISSGEITSLIAQIRIALEKDNKNTLFKIMIFVVLIIGIAVAGAIMVTVLK